MSDSGEPRPKPLLRGVSHQVAFFVAIPVVVWLLHHASTPLATAVAAVYGASLVALFGTSALYHRVHWDPVRRALMKRLDHSMIFLFIAGSYTPICLLGVGGDRGRLLIAIIWAGALIGTAQTLFWHNAPRALHVGIYVAIGWAGAFGLMEEAARLGLGATLAHVGGGVLYTLGAVTYARKRPDPAPAVFGYHEVFHALVILACASLYYVVLCSVDAPPR